MNIAFVRRALGGVAGCAWALLVIFGPAGTFQFWQAWTYLAVFLVANAALLVYLQRTDPKLLERRSRGPLAEREPSQKLTQLAAIVLFTGTFVLPSADRRFSWSHVPLSVTIAAYVLLGLGFLIVLLALRENTFAATNIAVEPGQKVISSGPYARVRHPYYSGLLVCILATSPAMGSWWGLLTFIPMTLLLARRIDYEERFLTEHLPGYAAYCRSVRFRLLPPAW
jgi:protein-S-isoprenylcysteine O-methyltransferase Ste14